MLLNPPVGCGRSPNSTGGFKTALPRPTGGLFLRFAQSSPSPPVGRASRFKKSTASVASGDAPSSAPRWDSGLLFLRLWGACANLCAGSTKVLCPLASTPLQSASTLSPSQYHHRAHHRAALVRRAMRDNVRHVVPRSPLPKMFS